MRNHLSFRKLDTIIYWGIFAVVFVLSALRYHIGMDTAMAECMYPNPDKPDFFAQLQNTVYEPGYKWVFGMLAYIRVPWVGAQAVHALFVLGTVWWFINRYAKRRILAVLIFMTMLYLRFIPEGFRESIAISIFLLSTPYILSERWLKYSILILIAGLMHYAAFALILLPAAIWTARKVGGAVPNHRLLLICAIAVFIALGYAAEPILRSVSHVTTSGLLPHKLGEYTTKYLGSRYLNANLNFKGITGYLLMWVVPAAYCLICGRQTSSQIFRILAIFSILAYCIGVQAPVVARYGNYFALFAIIMIADWEICSNFTNNRFLRSTINGMWALLIATASLLQLYSLFATDNAVENTKTYMMYWPYSSWLNPETNATREHMFSKHNDQ